jgi:probable F420-dependent oxidoreductase
MRFGVHLVAAGGMVEGEKITRVASHAEALGYDSLWVSDHIVFPSTMSTSYPYSPDGKLPFDSANPFLEPLTVLSYAAAVTRTIKIGTSVLIVPYRDPIVTAKVIASLDVLSGGRFVFGVGIGWLPEEFRALGQDVKNRVQQTEEALSVMKACWTEEEPSFHGSFYDFSGVKFAPKPVQRPHPPIWFGGNTLPALKRAAALGSGWHGVWVTPEEVAENARVLEAQCEAAGKSFDDFAITVNVNGKVPLTIENIKRYEEAGVSMLFVPRSFQADVDAMIRNLDEFERDVKSRLN